MVSSSFPDLTISSKSRIPQRPSSRHDIVKLCQDIAVLQGSPRRLHLPLTSAYGFDHYFHCRRLIGPNSLCLQRSNHPFPLVPLDLLSCPDHSSSYNCLSGSSCDVTLNLEGETRKAWDLLANALIETLAWKGGRRIILRDSVVVPCVLFITKRS